MIKINAGTLCLKEIRGNKTKPKIKSIQNSYDMILGLLLWDQLGYLYIKTSTCHLDLQSKAL